MRLGGSGGLSGAPPPQPTLRAGPPRLSAPTGPWPQHVAVQDPTRTRFEALGREAGRAGEDPSLEPSRDALVSLGPRPLAAVARCPVRSAPQCHSQPPTKALAGPGHCRQVRVSPFQVSLNHLVRVRLVSSEDRHTHLHAYRSCITWGWPTQDPSLWLNRRRVHPARPPCRRAQDREALQSLTEQPVTEVPRRSPSV